MLVKNIDKGPRGINAVQGQFVLNPGESRELDIVAAEAKVAKGTGWFDLSGDPVDADGQGGGAGGGTSDEREALKAEAGTLGIEYPRNVPTPKLKELVEAKRAEIAAAGQGGGAGQ